jgi:hypothetical protein
MELKFFFMTSFTETIRILQRLPCLRAVRERNRHGPEHRLSSVVEAFLDYRLHPRFTGDNATAPEHTNVPIAS